jgi:Holliday junction resolvase RusA-like endonuclease
LQRLEIPQHYFEKLPKKRLPSLNEVIAMHYRTYTKVKREVYRVICALARRKLKPVTVYPVRISFHWFVANRRSDPDNISAAGRKLILDSLQKAEILTNDGWHQFISSQDESMPFRDYYTLDKKNPRIIVEIESLEDENNAEQQSFPWFPSP